MAAPGLDPERHARRAAELAEEALQPGQRRGRAQLLAAVAQVYATLSTASGPAAPPPPPTRVPAAARRDPAERARPPVSPAAAPSSDRSTLFDRLRGQDGISQVVQDFYTRVLRDPQLTHYFEGVAMWRLQRHMVAFLVQATGGPASYDGRDMAAAHAGLQITGRDFDRVARHLVETLVAFGVTDSDVDQVVETIGPLRPHIVTAAPPQP